MAGACALALCAAVWWLAAGCTLQAEGEGLAEGAGLAAPPAGDDAAGSAGSAGTAGAAAAAGSAGSAATGGAAGAAGSAKDAAFDAPSETHDGPVGDVQPEKLPLGDAQDAPAEADAAADGPGDGDSGVDVPDAPTCVPGQDFCDKDCDGRLRKDIQCAGGDDCCDTDPAVRPGQTGWFGHASACGTFDYDCDGVETRRWTDTGSACRICWVFGCCDDDDRYVKNAPACGQPGAVSHCVSGWPECANSSEKRVQECH
jgi:hypothetical protein